MKADRYSELQVTTNFTFLRGGSHPEEIVQLCCNSWLYCNSYYRSQYACRDSAGMRHAKKAVHPFYCGLSPDLHDGPSLLAMPTNLEAYSRLSGLLTCW